MSAPLRLLLAAIIALAAPIESGLAAGTSPKTSDASALHLPKGGEPIDFSSDAGYVDEAHRTVVLSGHVTAQQGEVKLQADNIIAHYLTPEHGSADSQNGKIESLEATGNVVVTRPGEVVKAMAATYKMIEKQILMHGNVIATRGQSVVSGDNLVVDLVKQSVRLQASSPDGRVHGIFTPPASGNGQ